MQLNKKGEKVAKNTILLYVRMIILMIINLYTVRIVLNILGVEDYGIYNVVAGAVTMFSCITSVLSSSIQRFYSYYQGEKSAKKLTSVFITSLIIFSVVSVLVIVVGETFGLWFISNKLIIPEERLSAALILYHCSLLVFILLLLQTPFSAAVIAHEDMGIYTILSFLEYCLKLGLAIVITFIHFDHLVLYGFTLVLVQVVVILGYVLYSRRYYDECHYKKGVTCFVYKDLLAFSGWAFYSSLAGISMNQIITILINVFFGPVVNTARAISLQVGGILTVFSNSFITALRPQLIKSYAEGDNESVSILFSLGNKFVYYTLFIICVPLIINMDFILDIWLKVTDKQAILFSQMFVVYSMILALNNPISIIVYATGKVRDYNVYVEIFTLLCPVIVYLLFKYDFPAYYAYILMICAIILSHVVRIVILKKIYTEFCITDYLFDFLFKAIVISTLCILLILPLTQLMEISFLRFLIMVLLSLLIILPLLFFWGLKKTEREVIAGMFIKRK